MTSTSRTMLAIASILSCSSVGYGCNKTPQEAQQDGIEAQQKADEKANDARETANNKIAEADRDRTEAAAEARKTAAEAQANANEKIRDSNRVAANNDDKDNPRTWAQAKIDDVDNMIDAASAKAQTAPAKAKVQFTNGLQQVKRDRDSLRSEVSALEGSAGDRLDKNKEQFSDHVDRIKSNIRNLEKSL